MALYDGFFDAAPILDEDGKETGKYDREYGFGDFTGYFGEIIGSGVCVYENEDSFKVRIENGGIVISPGYLFIQGYWLRNDADYSMDLPENGIYAVLAHLNLGKRMIEILIEEKASPEVYPDSLVLSYITATSTGEIHAEDTRYNTDLCGVIDAIGSLADKVAYAIHYIDNEIDAKLAEAEANIAAQGLKLDKQIERVSALVDELSPPPVGTVKFSASKNIGPEWLQCDGSFISQDDYPELVAALGKITPGTRELWEGYNGSVGSGLTNGYLYNGTLWVFSVTDKRLYGYTGTSKSLKTLTVTGADKLTTTPANPVCLSIVKGHVFLAQNQTSANAFILLEASNFTGSGSVSMTERDVKPAINAWGSGNGKVPGDYLTPEVVSILYNWGTSSAPDVQNTFALCLGKSSMVITGNQYSWGLRSLVWKENDFSTARIITAYSYEVRTNGNFDTYGMYINTLFRYSHKNASELLTVDNGSAISGNYISLGFISIPNGTYDSNGFYSVETGNMSVNTEPIRTSSVAGNGRYIYRCFVANKKLNLRAGQYNPNSPYKPKEATIAAPALPSRANVFPDSVCYAANQDLWFVFTGTGVAFSQKPEDGASWGYLDTQDTLGVITQYGSLEYDPETNLLYISGQDTLNKGKLGILKLPELYNFANDGAWLPSIASDGIPAYIKAKSTGGEATGSTLGVTVLEPVYSLSSVLPSVAVTFNGAILGVGTSDRPVNMETGTFTAGLRILSSLSGTYRASLYINGSPMATINLKEAVGTESTVTRNISDYLESGVTLQWKQV